MVHASPHRLAAPRRSHARLRLDLPAAIVTLAGRQPVTLLDLSRGGARVLLASGERISGGVLRWLDFEAFGTPAWQAGRDIGIEFEDMLCLSWVVETRRLGCRPSTPAEEARSAARKWVGGL